MIKKALGFALLLVAGFVVLNFAIEGDMLPGSATSNAGKSLEETRDTTAGGVGFESSDDKDNLSKSVRVSIVGGMEIPRDREVLLPNGDKRRLRVYVLRAEDSRPMRDDYYRLDRVTVDIYETTRSKEDPRSVRAGQLRADQAFVQVGRDENGDASVAEDKDVDLIRANLVTEVSSRLKGLSLEADRLKLRLTDVFISLRTETPNQRFRLRTRDDSPIELTGAGLQANLPTDPEQPGTIHVQVNSDPVLTHDSPNGRTVLRSRGSLEYVERGGDGLAVITTSDHVVIDGLRPDAGGEPVRATGDSLHATMWRTPRRQRTGDSRTLSWRSMRLQGAPATLRGQGSEVSCGQLDVVPSSDGAPYLFTASGEPRMTWADAGKQMVFEASKRIHLVRLREHLRPLITPFGLPVAALNSQMQQLVIFEGKSSATTDGLVLVADHGLRVLTTAARGGPMTVVGKGEVNVNSTESAAKPLDIAGSHGFLLHRDHRGDTIRLGPQEAGAAHRFVVHREDLDVEGHGSCHMFRPAKPGIAGRIRLASPERDVTVKLTGGNGSLERVGLLDATFGPAGLETFEATGDGVVIAWKDGAQELRGRAARITSTTRDAYVLEGAPARLALEPRGTIEGRTIGVVRVGRGDLILTADGEAHAIVHGVSQSEASKSAPLSLDLFADHLRLLPNMVSEPLLSLHTPRPSDLPFGHSAIRSRYLIARGHVRIDKKGDDPSSGVGDRLVLWLGEDVVEGRLSGSPALITRRDPQGQTLHGEASDVLLAQGPEGETLSLLAAGDRHPVLTLAQRDARFARGGDSGGPIRITCNGDIRAQPEQIVFGGPVRAWGTTPNGKEDTGAFNLAADRVRMERHRKTGDVSIIHAFGSATLRWRNLNVSASDMMLDLERHLCIVKDRGGQARFGLADRVEWRGDWAEFDYVTMEVAQAWGTRMRGGRGRTVR